MFETTIASSAIGSQVFGIKELQLEIIKHLRRSALARLSQVNRELADECTKILWSDEETPVRAKHLRRISSQRKQYYTEVIRNLDLRPGDRDVYMDEGPLIYEKLSQFPFPNLVYLRLNLNMFLKPDEEKDYLDALLIPTARALDLHREQPRPLWNQEILSLLTDRLSNVERLILDGFVKFEDFSNLIQVLPKLTDISYHPSSSSLFGDNIAPLFEGLRKCSRPLEKLDLSVDDTEIESQGFQDFLRHFDMNGPRTLSVKNFRIRYCSDKLFTQAMLSLIVPDSIESLDLDIEARSDMGLIPCGLRDILKFGNLKKLRLKITGSSSEDVLNVIFLDENMLIDVANSCPELQVLKIDDQTMLLRRDKISSWTFSYLLENLTELHTFYLSGNRRKKFRPVFMKHCGGDYILKPSK